MQSNIKIRDESEKKFFFSTSGFTVSQMPLSWKTIIALMQTLSTNTVVYCCSLEIQQNTMIKLKKIL